MADVQVQYQALEEAARKVRDYRQAFDNKGQEIERKLDQLATTALVSEASDSVKGVGARFTTAFERTAFTLGNLAQWLDKVVQDYKARGAQSATGFDGINPGGTR